MDLNNRFGSNRRNIKAILGLLVFVNLVLFCLILYALRPQDTTAPDPDPDSFAGEADIPEDDESENDAGNKSEDNASGNDAGNESEDSESSDDNASEDMSASGSEDEPAQTGAGSAGSGNQNRDHEKEDVYYTVRCMYEDGEVFQDKIYKGEAGSSVSVTAPAFEGLQPTPERLEKTLSHDEDSNIFGFYYAEESLPEEETKPVIPVQNVLHYEGHTYFAYRTKNIDSYWEALDYAESCGGYLAVITDSEENRAVYDYVFDDIGYESAYFGLTDDGSEGDWYWIDGSVYDYDNFAEGQPDNHGGNENYALFWYGDRAYRWNDGDFGKDAAGTVTFLIEWDSQ